MNVNVISIAEFINASEGTLAVARQANYANYCAKIKAYSELSKTERKTCCERAVKGIPQSVDTVQNNFGRLLRAIANDIDVTLYVSFTGVETAAKKVEDGTAKVPKSGKNKGKAMVVKKAELEQEKEEEGVRIANSNTKDVIAKDKKTIAYLAYAIEQGWDLALVKQCIK